MTHLRKILVLVLFVPLFAVILGFKPGSQKFVRLKVQGNDTLFLKDKNESNQELFSVPFDLIVRNISKKDIFIHEDFLTLGNKDEPLADYYLEIYQSKDGNRIPWKFEEETHRVVVEYPGVKTALPPKDERTYSGTTLRYALRKPGKYYIKAIFQNYYKFLGESTVDSIVIRESSTN